jgi:hypothetical protein
MARRSLDSEVALAVYLSAICSRNRYTTDPAPVIAELQTLAGDRFDVLAEEAGRWAGYYDGEHTRLLCAALREIPGAAAWVGLGVERRGAPAHGTQGFRSNSVG